MDPRIASNWEHGAEVGRESERVKSECADVAERYEPAYNRCSESRPWKGFLKKGVCGSFVLIEQR